MKPSAPVSPERAAAIAACLTPKDAEGKTFTSEMRAEGKKPEPLTVRAAFEAAEAMPAADFGSFERDFQRRNGALPMHDGWPMVQLEDGSIVSLNPDHPCHTAGWKAAVADKKIAPLQPSNGR